MYGSPSSIAEQDFHNQREGKNNMTLKDAAQIISINLISDKNIHNISIEELEKSAKITFDELKVFFTKCSSNVKAGVNESNLVIERVGNSNENYCDFINFVSYLERKLSKFPPASSSMYVQTLVSLSEDIAREREMEPEEENVVPIKVEQKESTKKKKKKKKKKKIIVVKDDNNNSKETIVDENIENVKPSSSEVSISSTNNVIPAPPSTIKNNKPLSILNVKSYNNQKKIDDNEKSKSATTKPKSKRQQNMDVIRSLSAISEQAIEEIVETRKENIISNNNNKDDNQESSTAINNDTEDTSEFDDNIPSSLQASLLNSPSAPSSPKPKTTTSLQKDEKHIISSSSDSSTTRREKTVDLSEYVLKTRYNRMKEKIKKKANDKRINEINELKERFTVEIKEIRTAFQTSSKQAENIIDNLQMSEKKHEYTIEKLQAKLEKTKSFVEEFHNQEEEFKQKMEYFKQQERKNQKLIEQQKLKISQQQLKMDLLRDTIKQKDKQCQEITKHHQKMLDTSLKAAKKYYTKLYRKSSGNSSDSSSSSNGSPGGGR